MDNEIDIENIIRGTDIIIAAKKENIELTDAFNINFDCIGVYIFWLISDHAYIGYSRHVGYRLKQHMPDWLLRSKIRIVKRVDIYVTEKLYQAEKLEKILICRYLPELNIINNINKNKR